MLGRPPLVLLKYYNCCVSPASPGAVFDECIEQFAGETPLVMVQRKKVAPLEAPRNSGETPPSTSMATVTHIQSTYDSTMGATGSHKVLCSEHLALTVLA